MTTKINHAITRFLEKNPVSLTVWASAAAFLSYCCMYIYRKPFTAATYEGQSLWEIDYKISDTI